MNAQKAQALCKMYLDAGEQHVFLITLPPTELCSILAPSEAPL